MKTVKVKRENLNLKGEPITKTGLVKLVQKVKKIKNYSVKESMQHFEEWLKTRKNR